MRPASTRAVAGYVKIHARHMPPVAHPNQILSPNGTPLGLFFFFGSAAERAAVLAAACREASELAIRFNLHAFQVALWQNGQLGGLDGAPADGE